MSPPRIFVDTNVFVYAFDASEPAKRDAAANLIDTHREGIVISTQVLIELHAVCVRKLGLSRSSANEVVSTLAAFPVVDTDRDLVIAAADLAASDQLSIFDALIICAARRAGCDTLMTEDLQNGRHFGSLAVENPFER